MASLSPELAFKADFIPGLKHRILNQAPQVYARDIISNLYKDLRWNETPEGHTYWALVNYIIKGRVKLEGYHTSTQNSVEYVVENLKNYSPALYKELQPIL